MQTDIVLRSNTGKYHLGLGNASSCNGRSGKFTNATNEQVRSANDSSFCKKCFWKGKETAIAYCDQK